MKKYLLLNLIICFFFSPLIFAEAGSTASTPTADYSLDYAKENPPKVAPDTYYYINEGPEDRLIKVTPASDYGPDSVETRTNYSRTTPDYNPWFVPFDILITRPLGLATTLVGTALFVVFSPFTALSSIAPPHDAFERAADVFIVVPATYTFLRPVGKFLCPGDCRPVDIK